MLVRVHPLRGRGSAGTGRAARSGAREVTAVAELRELTITADPVYTDTTAEARSVALDAIRRRRARITVSARAVYGPERAAPLVP